MTSFWHKIGHRGSPREFPANTMRSFQRALEHGCTMVECDIRQAADGVLVLAHDLQVTDVHDSTFVITETPSAELQNLNLGANEGVPLLEELVTWAAGRCAIMADMKCEGNGVEEGVIAALRPLNTSAKVVPGAGSTSRAHFREIDPALPLSLTLSHDDAQLVEPENWPILLANLDTSIVTWHHSLLNTERISQLHEQNITVYAWTVDDLPTMRRLLEEGVDGIISNRADLLASL